MKVNLSKLVENLENGQNVQKTEEQINREINTREMVKYENIIRSIAGKYGRDWCLTFDEVYSELCFKILKLGTSNGWENLNESLVSRICYNRAVDLYRAARRRREREVQDSVLLTDSSNEEAARSKIGTVEEAEQNVLYSEFVKMFNPESRERKYLVIKMVSEGLIGEEYAIEIGIKVQQGAHLPDYRISEMLGLSPRSKSFEKMKKNLREELSDYFNIDSRF